MISLRSPPAQPSASFHKASSTHAYPVSLVSAKADMLRIAILDRISSTDQGHGILFITILLKQDDSLMSLLDVLFKRIWLDISVQHSLQGIST
ncbi:hypothetical protein A0H81_02304 [Grifola frondosa]|uniref:Uncharacterized protein n=1 Tax=Grifola frondosa TaxID=5627 RepID=A0A1C7MMG0_GRIFR|nr:hypothetical protein A0H81_02304 [Grifola frondosa]